MKLKLITREFGVGSQDCELNSFWMREDTGERFQVFIHSDWSYQNQSRCTISIWSGTQWQAVKSLHYSNMQKIESVHKNCPDDREDAFELMRVDEANLVELVEKILPE